MGEHTIREILRRRSPETQRALQRRRELQGGKGDSPLKARIIAAGAAIAILACIGYVLNLGHTADKRLLESRGTRGSDALVLSDATAFLSNTVLASTDPAFYDKSRGSLLTRHLVRVYFPDAGYFTITIMAMSLEMNNPKTAILEAYINDVGFVANQGHPIKGFSAASGYYFNKPFAQLAPQEVALLVALTDDPEGLDPRQHADKALAARNLVLQDDLVQNVLSQAQVDALLKAPLAVTPHPAP
ncbi:MAG TPA: transglycosylase domain-containing protein [Gammaproteobacteria bacterium]|nr:transglycosylase domain-containing protein [Gammaproteobacteria bacterium]